jgi:hypothetical protein
VLILGAMWKPTNIEEFEAAVVEGGLEERHDFDAKRQLPGNGKELAKDIAAMTTDGGALVYGVGKDEDERPRVLAAFDLAGARERIDQVAQNSIFPSPRVEFAPLRLPNDESRGYLVVLVPASALAPHQVSVGNDRRYYGRCETGNRLLTEAEIARLYDRRARLNVDRERLLGECIAASPVGPPEPGKQGFLQAFAQPVLRDDQLWDRAVEKSQGEEQILQKRLRDAVASVRGDWGGAHIGLALNWRLRGADKWTLDTGLASNDPDSFPVHRRALADLSMDGRCYMFYGGAADTTDRRSPEVPSTFLLYERGVALNLAQFMALVGSLYEVGAQYGPIDVGMAVTCIRGAISAHAYGDHLPGTPYQEDGAFRTARYDARELSEDPIGISRHLIDRLLRAMSNGSSWDPLAS